MEQAGLLLPDLFQLALLLGLAKDRLQNFLNIELLNWLVLGPFVAPLLAGWRPSED